MSPSMILGAVRGGRGECCVNGLLLDLDRLLLGFEPVKPPEKVAKAGVDFVEPGVHRLTEVADEPLHVGQEDLAVEPGEQG